MIPNHVKPLLAATLALALATGCGLHKARKSFEEGRYEESVLAYREVLHKDPKNLKARIGLGFATQKASEKHIQAAQDALAQNDDTRARLAVQRILALDPTNAFALDTLAGMELRRQVAADREQNELNEIRDEAERANAFELQPRSLEGVNLNFSRKTSLKEILTHLSQASGIAINFHTTANPESVMLQADLRGLSFARVLDTLMMQSDMFYRVIAPNTIMVHKATPQNRQQFEAQILKTFYISHATADQLKTQLQTILQEARIYADKRMNAIIMRGKPKEIALATRLVRALDKPKPEVMIYMELLEVTESSLEQVGLLPVIPTEGGLASGTGIYKLGMTLKDSTVMGMNSNVGGVKISRQDVRFLMPGLILDALKSSGDAKLVAQPNVRATSGESAEVMIGAQVSTTQSALGTGGLGSSLGSSTSSMSGSLGGYIPQTSFDYKPIGVTIKVEPTVTLSGEINLKIDASVTTQLAGSIPGRPDIGQRQVKTFARLRDGESAVFGGLLKEDETTSNQGLWGISDIPLIGKLLGNTKKNKTKTDVILTVRAVQIRRPELNREDFEAFDPEFSNEESPAFRPARKKPVAPATTTTPATPAATATPAAAQTPKVEPGKAEPGKAEPGKAEPGKAEPGKAETPKPEAPKPDAPAAAGTVEAKPAQQGPAPKESDLVIFCSPTSATAQKGERIQLALLVSGGRGLTNGDLELRLDNRLKLVQATPGDFLSGENGTLEQTAITGGVKLSFKRPTTEMDSGPLAILELEVVGDPGQAPVLLRSGRYVAGGTAVAGKVVNALITVE